MKELSKYEHDGFLVFEDFVDVETCDLLREHAAQLVEQFDPGEFMAIFSTHEQSRLTDNYFLGSSSSIRFFFEEDAFKADGSLKQSKEKSINKIGHALHDLDSDFSRFSRHPVIRELIRDLAIDDPLLLQSMYIFKQPHIGGEVICHQDSAFLYTEPIAIAGLWFALEEATIENGCLWAIPGGHKVGLKSRWIRTARGMQFVTLDFEPWHEEKLIPLEVRKGSLILLHGLLPHRSLENKSSKSRQAYTLHVISGKAHYPEDNWLQRSTELPLRGF